jgi:isopentenyl diphosphate isomerase/L-lactate dehydrogenase-like FMN-dependent dehydrogenase
MSRRATFTRRCVLQSLCGVPPLSLCAQAPADDIPAPSVPATELANLFEFRDIARRKLARGVYARIAGTERRSLERITLRPRLMVNVAKLDLTTELLGEKLFAPILIGPVGNLQAYHPDGELAMVRGASAAKSLMVVSARSGRKLSEVTAQAETPLWFQLYPDPDMEVTLAAAGEAVQAGCKVVCLTVGNIGGNFRTDWPAVARVKQSVRVPLLLKGIMSPEEALLAASHGVDGIVVSNHGAPFGTGLAEPIEVLPSIVEALGGKVPVLIDGGFRRGTDVLKALALGARAVLLGRPPVWGLAAYGAEGVQAVMEMLQTELARNMALCGKPDLRSLDRSLVKIHRR